jgi:hypothetical protein
MIDLAVNGKRRPVDVESDTPRHAFYRPVTLNRLRGALDADGRMPGWRHPAAEPVAGLVVQVADMSVDCRMRHRSRDGQGLSRRGSP